eukprot:277279-Pyramimonas_sp.AAC.1
MSRGRSPISCVVVRAGLHIVRARQSPIHKCRLRQWSTMGHDVFPLCLCPVGNPAQAGAPDVLQLLWPARCCQ